MMIKWISILSMLALAVGFDVKAGTLNVFACEPEWAALTEELGAEKVKVFTATTAFQDPHHIEARPSLIARTRRADLLVCTGSDLEVGWLPLLLRKSGNRRIQQSRPGYFMASDFVERLEIPEVFDRSHGDIHAAGNPHIHLDPSRLLTIAERLQRRLSLLDSENAAFYEARLTRFKQRWLRAKQQWDAMAQSLKGKRAIVHHRNWSYLLDWLGIEEVADLEPKPGVAPTTAHLARLITVAKVEKPDFILVAAYQDPKGARWLSKKTSIPVVVLPFTVGGSDDTTDLFSLFENTLRLMNGT